MTEPKSVWGGASSRNPNSAPRPASWTARAQRISALLGVQPKLTQVPRSIAAPSSRRGARLPQQSWRRRGRPVRRRELLGRARALGVSPTRSGLTNGLLVVNVLGEKFDGRHYVFLQKSIKY